MLLDEDTKDILWFSTNDTSVLKGSYTGTINSGWKINYSYGGESWNETLIKTSEKTATLIDNDGFESLWALGKVKDGETYLRQIGYLEPLTIGELPASSSDYEGMNYEKVAKDLNAAGFTNISYNVIYDLTTGFLVADGEVESVSISGTTRFKKGDWHYLDTPIVITYHTYKKNNPS